MQKASIAVDDFWSIVSTDRNRRSGFPWDTSALLGLVVMALLSAACSDTHFLAKDFSITVTRSKEPPDPFIETMIADLTNRRAVHHEDIDLINGSGKALHDVNLKVISFDSKGRSRYPKNPVFIGRWSPGETREVVVLPDGLEKVVIIIESREGEALFEIFDLPDLGAEIQATRVR